MKTAASLSEKGQSGLNPFRLTFERILKYGALSLALFHIALSIIRYVLGVEANFLQVPAMVSLVWIEFGLSVGLLTAAAAYLVITLTRYRKTRYRLTDALRRLCTADGLTLLALTIWCIVCYSVHGWNTQRMFATGRFCYELDFCICTLLLFPLGTFLSQKSMKQMLDLLFHAVMAVTTAFITYALVRLFMGQIWTLPNGLKVWMETETNSFYIGVNQNIAGSIGLTMILISLYMITSHRGVVRWIYCGAVVPHLLATLLTFSNACYLALMAVFALTGWMFIQVYCGKLKTVWRVLLGLGVALAAVVALALLRNFMIYLFREHDTAISVRERTFRDTGRRKLWPAALSMMVTSPKEFFFGTERIGIISGLKTAMTELFNATKTKAHTHNQILQIGVAMGVPAMLAYIAFLARTFVRSVRVLLRRAGRAVEGAWFLPIALLGIVIDSLMEPFLLLYLSAIGCLFHLFAGYVHAIDRREAKAVTVREPIGKRQALLVLAVLYGFFVLARFMLAVATHFYPAVADEFLNAHIARSVANGTGVLYMGQPAGVTGILYPLVLSPVYALTPAGSQYSALLLLWNALLINLSLFPAYGLAMQVTRDRKKALIAGALTLAMPDMALSGLFVSENILYPLFFALMYFGYRSLREHRLPDTLAVGILGGLICFTRPGHAVPAAILLLFALAEGIRCKSGRQLRNAGLGMLSMAAAAGLLWLLVTAVMGHRPGALPDIFGDRLGTGEAGPSSFVRALLLSPYLLLLGTGVTGFALLIRRHGMEKANRRFLLIVLLCAALTMLGTAWFFNRGAGDAVQTRSFAMYIPLLLIFALAPAENETAAPLKRPLSQRFRTDWPCWALAAYLVAATLVSGLRVGIRDGSVVSGLAVNSLRVLSPGGIAAASALIILIALGAAGLLSSAKPRLLQALCVGFVALFALANNAVAYGGAGPDNAVSRTDRQAAGDEYRVGLVLKNRTYLHVTEGSDGLTAGYLDVNSKADVQTVSLDSLLGASDGAGSVYRPFLPEARTGMIPENKTPMAPILVLDGAAYARIEPADSAPLLHHSTKSVVPVQLPAEGPWLRSFLTGTEDGSLIAGEKTKVLVYDQTLTGRETVLVADLTGKAGTALSYGTADQIATTRLKKGHHEYYLVLPVLENSAGDGEDPYAVITLQAEDSGVHVNGFCTAPVLKSKDACDRGPGQRVCIVVDNPDMIGKDVNLTFSVELKAETDFILQNGETVSKYRLGEGKHRYSITVPSLNNVAGDGETPYGVISMEAVDCDIVFAGYSLALE